jgi:hypothetical protein
MFRYKLDGTLEFVYYKFSIVFSVQFFVRRTESAVPM